MLRPCGPSGEHHKNRKAYAYVLILEDANTKEVLQRYCLCRTMYGEFSLAEKCDKDNCRYSTEKEKNLVCGKEKVSVLSVRKGLCMRFIPLLYPRIYRHIARKTGSSFHRTALPALDCYATERGEAELQGATLELLVPLHLREDWDLQLSPAIQQCFLLRLSGAIQIVCGLGLLVLHSCL